MPRACSHASDDPFDGLRLPMDAWKAIHGAHITNLEQLKAVASRLEQIQGLDPETALIIKDRLDRLAARRTVRVRLVFPKPPHRTTGRGGAHGSRRSSA
jgi:hypothetical protein